MPRAQTSIMALIGAESTSDADIRPCKWLKMRQERRLKSESPVGNYVAEPEMSNLKHGAKSPSRRRAIIRALVDSRHKECNRTRLQMNAPWDKAPWK